jgi:phospholipase/carboxylesterase
MTTSKIGPLRVHQAGGSSQGEFAGPAILLCHGFGAPGDDLVSLADLVDAGSGVRWFFPEAPLEVALGYGVAGRAWWPIDIMRLRELVLRGRKDDLLHETPPGLGDARAALESCIEALVRDHGVQRDRLLIGGFSQGAMLTTELALHADEPFAGLASLSGRLISSERWEAAAARSGPRLDALLTHGRADAVLPFDAGEALRVLLERQGARVTWVPHEGGHEIPEIVVRQLGVFARQRLGAG